VRETLNSPTFTKVSLKIEQKEQTQSKSRKQKFSPSCGWQRDLVESTSMSSVAVLSFKTTGFNRHPLLPVNSHALDDLTSSIFDTLARLLLFRAIVAAL